MSNYFLIIQARTGSKRFPEKIIKKIFGKPILEILIDRIKKEIDPTKIILATSLNQKDKIICDIAKKKKIKFFRGSENNVMSRFIEIGKIYNLDTIIRITSDCPLVDPKLIKKMSDEEAINYLSSLRQIGRWSSEMVLIFFYNRPNIWPVQDIGLLRAISNNYKKKILTSEIFCE